MKFTLLTLAFSALLMADPRALVAATKRALKSGDVEGELSIKDGDCKLECEWKAKEDRRLIRTNQPEMTYITVDHRKLGVVLKDVECTIEIGEDEFTKDIEFPTGWVLLKKKGDGADDYFGFATSFTVCCHIYASPCFVLVRCLTLPPFLYCLCIFRLRMTS
jgi:hypothetical protein